MFYSLRPHGLQHSRPPCPSPSPRVCPSSFPLNRWCHPIILSSVALFCLQSFPTSGSFPMSGLFVSGGQSIGASASASVFPMNTQGWCPLGLTGLIWIDLGLIFLLSNTNLGSSSFSVLFLPFHTVYGVLKARILKWFAIPLSSGPHFVRTLHHDPSILGGPTRHGS